VRTLVKQLAGPLLAAALALTACSSSNHPEYHPVTVSNFSQNVSYPVAVNNGGTTPAPVYVTPAVVGPAPAVVPWPAPPPPDFFR
jgi:hypothetical protein